MISFALAGCLAVWLREVQWSSKELPWSATENQWGQFPIDFDQKLDDFYFFFYFFLLLKHTQLYKIWLQDLPDNAIESLSSLQWSGTWS